MACFDCPDMDIFIVEGRQWGNSPGLLSPILDTKNARIVAGCVMK